MLQKSNVPNDTQASPADRKAMTDAGYANLLDDGATAFTAIGDTSAGNEFAHIITRITEMVRTLGENGIRVGSSHRSMANGLVHSLQHEKAVQDVLQCDPLIDLIWPSKPSFRRRQRLFQFVCQLMKSCNKSVRGFMFGSVPLRTYLPDGDIDIGAALPPNVVPATFLGRLKALLDDQCRNPHADYTVRSVRLISAEVQVVKFRVDNVLVDVSANTRDALGTVLFFEEADRKFGQDNLFKRTLLIAKAWCLYESHILASHNSLLSTYALETLVLYILNMFSSMATTPLQVLEHCLTHLATFDFDKYCITAVGPLKLSTLKERQSAGETSGLEDHVETSKSRRPLLSLQFLRGCRERYRAPQQRSPFRRFVPKYINIMDPLDEHNNLGRSVNYSNSFRIRKAFAKGARELRAILEGIPGALYNPLLPLHNVSPQDQETVNRDTGESVEASQTEKHAQESENKGEEGQPVSTVEKGDLPVEEFPCHTQEEYGSLPSTTTTTSTTGLRLFFKNTWRRHGRDAVEPRDSGDSNFSNSNHINSNSSNASSSGLSGHIPSTSGSHTKHGQHGKLPKNGKPERGESRSQGEKLRNGDKRERAAARRMRLSRHREIYHDLTDSSGSEGLGETGDGTGEGSMASGGESSTPGPANRKRRKSRSVVASKKPERSLGDTEDDTHSEYGEKEKSNMEKEGKSTAYSKGKMIRAIPGTTGRSKKSPKQDRKEEGSSEGISIQTPGQSELSEDETDDELSERDQEEPRDEEPTDTTANLQDSKPHVADGPASRRQLYVQSFQKPQSHQIPRPEHPAVSEPCQPQPQHLPPALVSTIGQGVTPANTSTDCVQRVRTPSWFQMQLLAEASGQSRGNSRSTSPDKSVFARMAHSMPIMPLGSLGDHPMMMGGHGRLHQNGPYGQHMTSPARPLPALPVTGSPMQPPGVMFSGLAMAAAGTHPFSQLTPLDTSTQQANVRPIQSSGFSDHRQDQSLAVETQLGLPDDHQAQEGEQTQEHGPLPTAAEEMESSGGDGSDGDYEDDDGDESERDGVQPVAAGEGAIQAIARGAHVTGRLGAGAAAVLGEGRLPLSGELEWLQHAMDLVTAKQGVANTKMRGRTPSSQVDVPLSGLPAGPDSSEDIVASLPPPPPIILPPASVSAAPMSVSSAFSSSTFYTSIPLTPLPASHSSLAGATSPPPAPPPPPSLSGSSSMAAPPHSPSLASRSPKLAEEIWQAEKAINARHRLNDQPSPAGSDRSVATTDTSASYVDHPVSSLTQDTTETGGEQRQIAPSAWGPRRKGSAVSDVSSAKTKRKNSDSAVSAPRSMWGKGSASYLAKRFQPGSAIGSSANVVSTQHKSLTASAVSSPSASSHQSSTSPSQRIQQNHTNSYVGPTAPAGAWRTKRSSAPSNSQASTSHVSERSTASAQRSGRSPSFVAAYSKFSLDNPKSAEQHPKRKDANGTARKAASATNRRDAAYKANAQSNSKSNDDDDWHSVVRKGNRRREHFSPLDSGVSSSNSKQNSPLKALQRLETTQAGSNAGQNRQNHTQTTTTGTRWHSGSRG
eukprot:g34703.t1